MAKADFVIVGWREGDEFVVCASADLTRADVECVRDLDAEMLGRLRGRPVRVTATTWRYAFSLKAKTCYMARSTRDYGTAIVDLVGETDFNPDVNTPLFVDVEESETLEIVAAVERLIL